MMQKSGKVVVVSQHYPPDPSTTAAIMAATQRPVAVYSGAAEVEAHLQDVFGFIGRRSIPEWR